MPPKIAQGSSPAAAMGKRLQLERPTTDRSARKRKRSAVKAAEKRQRLSGGSSSANGFEFHENDDEESCSSAGSAAGTEADPPTLLHTPQARSLLLTGASIASDHNNSSVMESPRPVYTLRPSVVNGTILRDVLSKAWRLGRPIGKCTKRSNCVFKSNKPTICFRKGQLWRDLPSLGRHCLPCQLGDSQVRGQN